MNHRESQTELPLEPTAGAFPPVVEVLGADLPRVLADLEGRGLRVHRMDKVTCGSWRLHLRRALPDEGRTTAENPHP